MGCFRFADWLILWFKKAATEWKFEGQCLSKEESREKCKQYIVHFVVVRSKSNLENLNISMQTLFKFSKREDFKIALYQKSDFGLEIEISDTSSDCVCHTCACKIRNAFNNSISSSLQKVKHAAIEVFKQERDIKHKMKFSDNISDFSSSMMLFNRKLTILVLEDAQKVAKPRRTWKRNDRETG